MYQTTVVLVLLDVKVMNRNLLIFFFFLSFSYLGEPREFENRGYIPGHEFDVAI